MAKKEHIALRADPNDPDDFDVSEEGLQQAVAERDARRRKPGRPEGSLSSNKQQVALRVDKDVLEVFRAGGRGWQTRMNDALRKAAGL
jgi:uncharacterized protein (DUF4415 family)